MQLRKSEMKSLISLKTIQSRRRKVFGHPVRQDCFLGSFIEGKKFRVVSRTQSLGTEQR